MPDVASINADLLGLRVTDTWQLDVFNANQSWNVVQIVTSTGGLRYRAKVHRDGYDNQSYGSVESWTDAAGWAEVLRRPITALVSGNINYTAKADAVLRHRPDCAPPPPSPGLTVEDALLNDAVALLATAMAILEGPLDG